MNKYAFFYINGINTYATLLDIGYNYYNEAFAFEVNSSHKCNDDCVVQNDGLDCICNIDGTHPAHKHSYGEFLPYEKDYHYSGCICGIMLASTSAYHVINANNIVIDENDFYSYCIICNKYLYLNEIKRYLEVRF